MSAPAEIPAAVARLNWGCGAYPELGWINSDQKDGPGIDVSCDIRNGLPFPDACFDYAVSIHALPELPLDALTPALAELRRVLRPGGVLRLGLPDLEKGLRAFLAGDRGYFLIPDEDARSLGGKLVTQLLWYGWSRSLFTRDSVAELLERAGFREIAHCAYRTTPSPFPEIVELDNREGESLFVEGTR